MMRLKEISLLRQRVTEWSEYPFNIPAIASLHSLEITSRVCFFVGENGTGKSTLLEATASHYGFGLEGGNRNFSPNTTASVRSIQPLVKAADLRFQVQDRPAPQPGDEPSALYSSVSPAYFDVLHVSLLRGRLFTDEDNAESSRVVIINENFARQNFPGANPVGRHLAILGPGGPGQPKPGIVQIVGMTANVHAVGFDEVPFAEMYFPYLQEPARDVYVALRMVSGVPASEGVLRGAVSAIDKDAPVSEIKTMKARISESLGENCHRSSEFAFF